MRKEITQKVKEIQMIYAQFKYVQLCDKQDCWSRKKKDYSEDLQKWEKEQWRNIIESEMFFDISARSKNAYDDDDDD